MAWSGLFSGSSIIEKRELVKRPALLCASAVAHSPMMSGQLAVKCGFAPTLGVVEWSPRFLVIGGESGFDTDKVVGKGRVEGERNAVGQLEPAHRAVADLLGV